jgi:hypothetical protein
MGDAARNTCWPTPKRFCTTPWTDANRRHRTRSDVVTISKLRTMEAVPKINRVQRTRVRKQASAGAKPSGARR